MVLGLIELGQGSGGSEPPEPVGDSPSPCSSTHPPGKAKRSVSPPAPPPLQQFLQLNQNSHGTKINVAIVGGAKRHVLTMANAKNSKWQGPAGLLGSHRFDYEEGQRCFSRPPHKGGSCSMSGQWDL